jgi:uncharacterized phage protein (TIGR01671 family)
MREIRFRAWDKEAKIMVYNIQNAYDTINNSLKGFRNGKEIEDFDEYMLTDTCSSFGEYLDSEYYEIMQYTGLKDKNGKEIYEGDICRWYSVINDNDIEEEHILPIEHNFGAYTFNSMPICEWINERGNLNFEIIGNIYENPELIKESER